MTLWQRFLRFWLGLRPEECRVCGLTAREARAEGCECGFGRSG